MLAAPIPTISWLACTSLPDRAANADDTEIVSASDTTAMPSAPAIRMDRSPSSSPVGIVNGGRPSGRTPTSCTPRAARSNTTAITMATITAISTLGSAGRRRLTAIITAMLISPTASAAGTRLP